MDLPDILLKIVDETACPLYRLGDEFSLNGTSLVMPHEKAACLILIKDITALFLEKSSENPRGTFRCSGCTGRIMLAYKTGEVSAKIPPHQKPGGDMAAVAGLLGRFEIFKTLDKEEVKELVALLRMKKFHENDIIIRKGEPGRFLFIIISGRVEVLGDNEVSIAFLGSGEVFGEMSLLSGEPVTATIKVVEPSRILYVSAKDFRLILIRYPSLQLYFTKLLARRLATTNVARAEEFASGMIGKLSDMPPSEIFQTLNTNQKTGILALDLMKGTARISFREGQLVRATYGRLTGVDAFFEILRENQGRFKFLPGLPDEDLVAEPLGDFMWLLMEGVRKIDESA